MSTIVEVTDLHKQYNPPDGVTAVQGVSFAIRQGEIFSMLGPNGAGKSTTISMLSGLLTPTGGDAVIDGHSIRENGKAVKQVIGVVPQEIALYDTITARENLVFWGKMYGLSGVKLKERVTTVLEIAGLTDRADEKVETFSGGMKRRINIAVGLLHNPKVLYMDEPTVGIDPQSRRRILDTVKELNAQGLTVLYTTHYMEEAEELSDRIGIIDHGKLIVVGTQEELTATIGQYDTVRLDIGETAERNGTLVTDLARLDGVHQVDGESESVIVQAKEANAVLPHILEPNLEAVFLHLTGRALRD